MNKKTRENMIKSNHIAGIMFFMVVMLIGVWCIDVSVSALLNGGKDAFMTNGFFNTSPLLSYHIGLYWVLFSMFGVTMTYSHYIIMGKNEKRKK